MALAICLVLAHVFHDWYRIERQGKPINHIVGASVFMIAAVAGAGIVLNPWFLLLVLAIRLLIFDYSLNLARGLRWDYLGKGAMTDKILKKINKWTALGLRLLLFVLACVLYY